MSSSVRLSPGLRSKVLRGRSLADRVRRKLHRSSYWRSKARRYPLNGLAPEVLRARVAEQRDLQREESRVVPLPDVEIHGGRCYYAQQDLGPIDSDLAESFEALTRGDVAANLDALVREGLALRTRGPVAVAPRRALILSPHRDDASLSLGGLMASRAREEEHFICNVFTVSAWLGNDFAASPMRTISGLRAREEAMCNEVLGTGYIGLGLWEADIRTFYRQSTERYQAPDDFIFAGDPKLRSPGERDCVQHAVSHLLHELEPARVYFPAGVGCHIDHIFLRDLGRQRAAQIGAREPTCQVYFYEDQPYATYEHIDVDASIAACAIDGHELIPEYIDISDSFEVKIQAIAAHRSQFRRSENEDRLRAYAARLARRAGLPEGALAARIWRVAPR